MSRHGWLACALCVLLVLGAQVSLGAVPVAAAAPAAQGGQPNRVDAAAGTRSVTHLPAPPRAPATRPAFDQPRPAPQVPMRLGLVGLDPDAGAHFVGSDGVLELTASAGAVTAADVAAAAGGLSLSVRQLLPASGSNAGGSGHFSFGTWLVQVVDGAGRPAPRGLRQELSDRRPVHPGVHLRRAGPPGPLGSYAYGASAHVHAATAIGTSWTAAYDAAGNMTCRAPSSSSTCVGTQSGAQLAYNNEGEMTTWQNAPTSPSTTARFLYDGQGQRVAQQVTSGSTTTTTVYVGGVEEVATTGATTTTTAYYYAGGKRIALSVNGTVSYLATDGLGSANVTLSAGGSPTASVLYAPYGDVRYSSGTMPTTYGFTGQRADAASGLDYYGARYYDPLAGQFTSGDSVVPGAGYELFGLSRYAYVAGNPVNRIDPIGQMGEVPGNDGGTCALTDQTCGGGQEPPTGTGSSNTGPTPCPLTGGTCVGGKGNGNGGGGGSNGGGGGGGSKKQGSSSSERNGKFISNTCAQFGGVNVGSCAPMSWNLNLNPDYGVCLDLGLCDWVDPDWLSLGSLLFSNGGGDPESEAAQQEEQVGASDTVRIRHYTNRRGINGIEDDGVIRAGDKNSVFAESARGKPRSPRDAEDVYGLVPGHGRDYVETDVAVSRVQRVWNKELKVYELMIHGDIRLLNAVFLRRR